MSREIKFRAYNESMKRIEDVVEIDFEMGTVRYKAYPETAGDEDIAWNYLKDIALVQYTGLKDKNGLEIYEGDILHYDIPEFSTDEHGRGVVEFGAGSFYAMDIGGIGIDVGCISYTRNGEVIGNTYENKELLDEDTK